MRSLDRISPFVDRLGNTWANTVPDWRFGQLMINFFGWHQTVYGNDGFYLEEDEFLKRLNEFLESIL